MRQILVVEDDWDSRQIMRTLLEGAHYEVIEAVTGPEGVKSAKQHQPDLILMDGQLPGYDGFEAIRKIKEEPALQTIPIIIVTSLDITQSELKAKGVKCDGFFTKPVDFKVFLDTIQGLLT